MIRGLRWSWGLGRPRRSRLSEDSIEGEGMVDPNGAQGVGGAVVEPRERGAMVEPMSRKAEVDSWIQRVEVEQEG